MKAIVVVDLQRAFPIPATLCTRIAERARVYPLRIFTRFVNPPGSLFRRVLDRHSCPPAAREAELLLEPQPGDLVLEKASYGFTSDQLAEIRRRGVDQALVCGADTDACVLAIVFSLFDHGIVCEVDPSLCWSSGRLQREALAIIREQFNTGWPPAGSPGHTAPQVGT